MLGDAGGRREQRHGGRPRLHVLQRFRAEGGIREADFETARMRGVGRKFRAEMPAVALPVAGKAESSERRIHRSAVDGNGESLRPGGEIVNRGEARTAGPLEDGAAPRFGQQKIAGIRPAALQPLVEEDLVEALEQQAVAFAPRIPPCAPALNVRHCRASIETQVERNHIRPGIHKGNEQRSLPAIPFDGEAGFRFVLDRDA